MFSEVVCVGFHEKMSLKLGLKLLATYGWRMEMWWKWTTGAAIAKLC